MPETTARTEIETDVFQKAEAIMRFIARIHEGQRQQAPKPDESLEIEPVECL